MDTPEAETRTGDYHLKRLLGRGSFSEVYLGEQLSTGKAIVFKRLHMSFSPDDLVLFVSVMRVYAALLHPHLVRILEIGQSSSEPFIVMEYASAGSLRQRHLPGAQVQPEVVMTYVRQIEGALQHLHRQGRPHLNLKPENVLLKEDGALVLSDAGLLSVPVLHRQRMEQRSGSAAYLAPEQILGEPLLTSDQYALGCMLYEWLTGEPPFRGSFDELCAQHLYAPPLALSRRLAALSPRLAATGLVIERALAKDPLQRFPSIEVFAQELDRAWQEGSATPAEVITAGAQVRAEPSSAAAALPPPASSMQTAGVPPRLCRLCRQPLPAEMRGSCPACGYPADPLQEQHLLETVLPVLHPLARAGMAMVPVGGLAQLTLPALLLLRREAQYGRARLSLAQLIDAYARRLGEVRQLTAARQQRVASAPPARAAAPAGMRSPLMGVPSHATAFGAPPRTAVSSGGARSGQPAALVRTSGAPTGSSAASAPPVCLPPRRSPVAILRPLIESPTALMVALGTFLLVIAILVLPFAFRGSPLPLPVTAGAQAFFALMVVVTSRSTRFREFTGIYATFFAITVPLLALDLFQGALITNFWWLVTLAALYAAATYGALAVYQRFSPFAILAAVALIIACITLVIAVTADPHWVTGVLLVLALVQLEALPHVGAGRPSPLERLFATSWEVLRPAMAFSSQLLAFGIIGIYGLLTLFLLLAGLWSPVGSGAILLLSLLSLLTPGTALVALLLALVWLIRYTGRRQWREGHHAIALHLVPCALLPSYAYGAGLPLVGQPGLQLLTGLALLALALFYEASARLAPEWFWLYLRPDRALRFLRLALLVLLPLWLVPGIWLDLLKTATLGNLPILAPSPLLVTDGGVLVVGAALAGMMLLAPAPEVNAAGRHETVQLSPWWLLLVGLLVIWGYAAIGMGLNWLGTLSLWWLLLLASLLITFNWGVRRRFGVRWSAPGDLLTLAVVALVVAMAVMLASYPGASDAGAGELALLVVSLGLYGVLLAQRRSLWLFLPWLSALLWAEHVSSARALLVAGLLLPIVAAVVRRMMPAPQVHQQPAVHSRELLNTPWQWDWPLSTLALMSGLVLVLSPILSQAALSISPTLFWPPAVSEALVLAICWYLAALLGRDRSWVWPAALFALIALLQANQAFWVLSVVAAGTGLVGSLVSRLPGRRWAVPWYVVAAISMSLVLRDALKPPWWFYGPFVLSALAGVAMLVALIEALPEILWLVPVFAAVASYTALWVYPAGLNPAYIVLLPAGALLCAALAPVLGIQMLRVAPATEGTRRRRGLRERSVAPLYTAALVFAGATGLAFWEPQSAAFQLPIALLMLLYALVAFVVVVREHFPLGASVVIGLSLWGAALLLSRSADGLALVALGSLLTALLADRLIKVADDRWPVHLRSIVRPSWGLIWVPLLLLAWVGVGFVRPSLVAYLPQALQGWWLALVALLIYLSALLLRQAVVGWIAVPLLAVALLAPLLRSDVSGLSLCCGVCILGSVLLRLSSRHLASPDEHWLRLAYEAPLALGSGLAVVATGVAGNLSPHTLLATQAGLLLLAGTLALWLYARQSDQPLLTLPGAPLGIWGLLLVQSGPAYRWQSSQISSHLMITLIAVLAWLLALLMPATGSRRQSAGHSSVSSSTGRQTDD